MPKPKILIGVPNNQPTVDNRFALSTWALDTTGISVSMAYQNGKSIGLMRQELAKICLAGDFTHLLFLDNDMVYPQNMLKTLLAQDKDAVNVFSVSRDGQHTPIFLRWRKGRKADFNSFREWPTIDGTQIGSPLQGNQRVHVVGGAGLLIKRYVLEKLDKVDPSKPFFFSSDSMQEDMFFSIRCDCAGIKLYTHVDMVAGHLCTFEARPTYTNDGWIVERKY